MERDDLIVNDSYSLNAHHSEEDGVKIRKNIWKVTVILTPFNNGRSLHGSLLQAL